MKSALNTRSRIKLEIHFSQLDPAAQLFTYVPKDASNQQPSAMYPILQSYVDLCAG